MPLPYSDDALQPVVSAETLQLHHGKHHRTYVKKTNDAIAGSTLAEAPVEEIIVAAKRTRNDTLFNNAAQVWNHGFYWHSLAPEPTPPAKPLSEAIIRQFGSLPQLRTALVETGMSHFGSGWVWLVREGHTLKIVDTHDAETAIGQKWLPLLVIDVWEHAYYVDHRNEREAYLKAVSAKLLNWQFASQNFENDALWRYA